jgi:hypothetical protein
MLTTCRSTSTDQAYNLIALGEGYQEQPHLMVVGRQRRMIEPPAREQETSRNVGCLQVGKLVDDLRRTNLDVTEF